jgi:hypothetical protein
MQKTLNGIFLGGALITAVAVLFRMGHPVDPVARATPPRAAQHAERLSRLQPPTDKPADLLALIDPLQDAVSGQWRLEGGALVCRPAKEYVRLQVPCAPPSAYDLELLVERRGPVEAFVIGLPVGDRQVAAHFDGKLFKPDGKLVSPVCTTLRLVDGQSHNDTLFPGPLLKDKGVSTILCSVRPSSVKVSVDGLKVLEFTGNLRRLSLPQPWSVPSQRALFIGAYDCEYRISGMTFRPAP